MKQKGSIFVFFFVLDLEKLNLAATLENHRKSRKKGNRGLRRFYNKNIYLKYK